MRDTAVRQNKGSTLRLGMGNADFVDAMRYKTLDVNKPLTRAGSELALTSRKKHCSLLASSLGIRPSPPHWPALRLGRIDTNFADIDFLEDPRQMALF